MIPRFLIAAGMAVWLINNPAGTQGFSGGNPQNATQAVFNAGSNVGDATCALLKAQHDGTYADGFVPLREEQAVLAYQCYFDSFSQPMPGLSQTVPSTKSTSSSQATTAR